MFKCFSLSFFFFGFAVVNFGAFDFKEEMYGEEQIVEDIDKDNVEEKEENKEDLNIENNKTEDMNNVSVDKILLNEHIEKNQVRNEKNLVVSHEDNFEQLVLYYYIAVSFLLYAYKKVDSTTIFSELGDEKYEGPIENDAFAVYKEFSGSDSQSMSTYHNYLSFFCKKALTKFLGGQDKISYCDAYEKLYNKIVDFLSQVEKINIKLGNKWEDESEQWAFTVALQVFAYKKIYEYLNKGNISLEGNNKNPALQHDLVYVKFLSEMMYNIFKKVLESFSSDPGNTIRSRDLFFLKGLKLENIGFEKSQNMFCSAFFNLVFRPAQPEGCHKNFLDCFYPIIDQMRWNK